MDLSPPGQTFVSEMQTLDWSLQACFLGHVSIVQRLCRVENIDINFRDDDGFSALLLAVWNNQLEVVEALRTVEGLDWNVQSYKGKSKSEII